MTESPQSPTETKETPTPTDALQQRLDYQFKDSRFLTMALTHPSRCAESIEEMEDNQRLEYLGDAVLQLVISDELFHRFPKLPEGKLTQMRAKLVRRDMLARVASGIDLGTYLALGRGEERNSGRDRPSNLADAFEALLGAIYLDAGWPAAKEVTERLLLPEIELLEPESVGGNPKGALQEKAQADGGEPPSYRLESVEGPPHARRYTSSVHFGGKELARGSGSSKKEAEIAAAAEALKTLSQD